MSTLLPRLLAVLLFVWAVAHLAAFVADRASPPACMKCSCECGCRSGEPCRCAASGR